MTATRQTARPEMIDVIARFAKTDGDHMTQIAGLSLHRHGGDAPVNCSAYRPSLAIIVQGAKRVVLGEETLIYGASDYLLTSIDLPVLSQVCQASADEPYLSMAFTLDPGKIQALLASLSQLPTPAASVRGMSVSKITVELEDAALRLLRLLERPDDIPALLPLIEQEILYRLLTGPHGHRLRQMATTDSQPHQVGRAVAWLKEHYSRPLRIDDLANRVSMSVSSLHHHFKAITAMSPLQYQKQLRLQEARRLMLEESLDAGDAGHQVGYESQSQFSREYARHFGEPPMRDIGRVRRSLLERLAPQAEMLSEG
ncbi:MULTISPECIES: AraC family transcriptional regulator [Ensifer]|uniref:AraC family transcriptional regulator n=1 Tax=Ensifer adhaerens TaxID=106592 RepID=A0ABY8HCE8_ENSAD|nr:MULTISPECIES: AraC family transcriptional regulator [Ensifer]ANK73687.1 AraC family transcriptional regulator [Ensifer adhaerens]KDP70357.1 AraC family transcriptional regulator [Ensifer adhaerens]KQX27081.1 AraC family transcriptional regulator [Ensifer sp. Root423]KQZ58885.1 AraC family transcriptional regulator [Ensifer sp. Root558]MBD9542135.1 AraC family transcriptional regulator [Ensifer sp. ENS04]